MVEDHKHLESEYIPLVAESIGAAVTFVLLMALGIKVYTIVKFTNKWLLSMMVVLNLSVLGLIVFSSLVANYIHNEMQQD